MIMATTVNLLVNSYLVNADKKLKQKKVDLMTLTENHSVGKWCDGEKNTITIMTLLQYHVAVMGQWCFFDGIWPHRRRNEALLHASAEKQLTDTDCGENGVFFS